MLLPPIGTPLDSDLAGDICSKIMLLKQEARLVRQTYEEWADLCRSYYTYGAAVPMPDGTVIPTDIQNQVITQTDVQTKEPPSITLEPVDTGEPPKYFPALTPQACAMFGLQPQEYLPHQDAATGKVLPPQPLSPPSVMRMQQAIQSGMLSPTSLIEVSPSETADFFQKIFDVVWKRSNPEEWYWENVLWNNVDGWVPSLYEFDDDEKKHVFTNMPIRQVFMDPTASTVEKAAYVILDIVYDAEVAKKLYPDYADEIEQFADPVGKIQRPPETLEMGSQYEDVPEFQRPIVTITIAFLRDQETLLSPQEALQNGHLEQRPVSTGNWTPSPTPDNPAALSEETRPGLFPPDGDEETHPPGHDLFEPLKWPTRRCIRQICTIATKSVVLEDVECSYWDIPISNNINIPILGKPYGIGEPFRLAGMQDGRTRLLNNALEHSDYFSKPITWGPLSARELLPEEFQDGHSLPGAHFWIPDDLIAKTNGKPMGQQDPPPMPPVLMLVDDKLKREMNDQGGNVAALQGQPAEQLGQLSGVAIGMIQNGAASLASFKARRLQSVIKRQARLALHSILTRMTAADYGKIIKKYPPNVLAEFASMGADMEWTVNVTVNAGAGAMLAQKKAEAKDNFQRGLQSRESTQEAIGLDPRQEQERMEQEAKEQAQTQAMLAPPAPQQPPKGASHA